MIIHKNNIHVALYNNMWFMCNSLSKVELVHFPKLNHHRPHDVFPIIKGLVVAHHSFESCTCSGISLSPFFVTFLQP
jgi:hypothetical protein